MPNPKCEKCAKTVYPLEAESNQGKTWHKGCFRCQGTEESGEVCNIKITQKTCTGVGGKIYCAKHVPKDKPTAITVEGSMALSGAKEAQKMGSAASAVNNEKRGDGAEKYIGADCAGDMRMVNAKRSQAMGSAANAVNNEKRGDGAEKYIGSDASGDMKLVNAKRSQAMSSEKCKVNEQVRGESAGQRNAQVADMATTNAMAAPKTSTVNEQVRGEGAGQRNAQVADMTTSNAINAPRAATVNEQVRVKDGSYSQDVADMRTQTALDAPKVDVAKKHG
eukprot:TRINITY_DN36_c1_g1_i1.p1 TRINITY_DN36_c1_g1~~TRINITY_DN36_c1_g1_i1.p1  ORF type:complete len:278 (-),score=101.57 TRINITY_DN36_c1_g1_i1:120-953(-)